jgi:hypothetical protein
MNWREIIHAQFVRHCLQGGFQIQLTTNETLQVIFEERVLLNRGGRHVVTGPKRIDHEKTIEASNGRY